MKSIKIVIPFVLFILFAFSACKTIEYVPVEKVVKEYVARTDTTIVYDSLYIKEKTVNDTIFITQDKYHYITKIKSDTINKVDSIPYIKEVEVPVKYVPSYYKNVSWLFWCLIAGIVIFTGIKLYFKFK